MPKQQCASVTVLGQAEYNTMSHIHLMMYKEVLQNESNPINILRYH